MAGEAVIDYSLRADLEVIPGTVETDGSRSYMIYDPLASTFDRIEWPEYEIVRRLRRGTTPEALRAEVTRGTTLRLGAEEVAGFLRDLDSRGFLAGGKIRPVDDLVRLSRQGRMSPVAWLLSHYLYFRVPLLRPDGFLGKTLWLPRLLGWWPCRVFFWLMAAVALFLLSTRVELFWSSIVLFLSWKNAVWLTLATVAVKAAHEFSHAYAGKLRGARISGMGIAFMVMFPLPYSDITDSWRLSRKNRLAISFAGVRTELVIAVFAFIGWACSPPGVGRDIFLILCSGSLASTLFTNLNPGMRFDGYYLLSDLLAVDNLQQRAFAYFRRSYRRLFLGIPLYEPETRLSRRQKALLCAYTVYAWLYRMSLYFGIAVAVYHYFPKAIGVFLFAVEFALFLVRPVFRELADIWRLRKYMKLNPRIVLTCLAAAGLLFWLAFPLPRRVALPAATVGRHTALVYAPWGGEVVVNRLRRGERVAEGDVVFSLCTPRVELELKKVGHELDEVRTLLLLASGSEEYRHNLHKTASDEKRLLAARSGLESRLGGNVFTAPFSGVVLDGDDTMRSGLTVAQGRYVGQIVDDAAGAKIAGYVTEEYVDDVREGAAVWFVPDSDPDLWLPCRIERVSRVNAERLEEPALAEAHGGSIATTRARRSSLQPATTMYRFEAEPDTLTMPPRLGQIGKLYIRSRPRSLIAAAVRRVAGIVIRESGF